MPKLVVNGAMLTCDQGIATSTLVVAPVARGDIDDQPIATVADHVPNKNIPPFGMCQSMSNPAVAAATAAAMGALTPQPCVPVTSSPWSSGSTLGDLRGNALLTSECTCKCQWLGDDHKCMNYDERPSICRDYSDELCDRDGPESDILFRTVDEL